MPSRPAPSSSAVLGSGTGTVWVPAPNAPSLMAVAPAGGGAHPYFGDQGTLVIEVVPVTGETRTDNNKAEYPVKITI